MGHGKINYCESGTVHAKSIAAKDKNCLFIIEYGVLAGKKTFKGFEYAKRFWTVNCIMIFYTMQHLVENLQRVGKEVLMVVLRFRQKSENLKFV